MYLKLPVCVVIVIFFLQLAKNPIILEFFCENLKFGLLSFKSAKPVFRDVH